MSKAETKSTVLLEHHLTALKRSTVDRKCEAVVARCARENVDHLGFLLQLLRAGMAGARGPDDPEAEEAGPVPDGQGARGLRLRGRTEAEQAPGISVNKERDTNRLTGKLRIDAATAVAAWAWVEAGSK